MGRKKIKKPAPRPTAQAAPGLRYALAMEARLAMDEYRTRKEARESMARNDEIKLKLDTRDAHLETWMWGLMALVLHRKYRWTSQTIAKIFTEIQNLHNEIYDSEQSYEATTDQIVRMVNDEVGLDIVGEV